jgi:hypothetical protein
MTEEQWQYATWGAIVVGVVAIVALIAVVFGLLSKSDRVASGSAGAETAVTTTTVAMKTGLITEFPVTYPSVVESPRVGDSARYHQDGAVIAVRITLDECERSDGMLKASGSIRNDTPFGQTLDYSLGIELKRPAVGTSLASLEAAIPGLSPRETAEWSVETVSTKAVGVRCEVATLTVAPVESR